MSFAFESFQAFLHMGGYAFNVWASFFVAFISIFILTVIILQQAASTQHLVKRQVQLLSQKEKSHT